MKKATEQIVFVSPVPRISAQGRDKRYYTSYTTGGSARVHNLNQTHENNTSVQIKFYYKASENKYVTGLDELVPNEFQGQPEAIVAASSYWSEKAQEIAKHEMISLQTLYEIKDNVAPGYYTNVVTNDMTIFNFIHTPVGQTTPKCSFIESFKLILYPNGLNRFTSETVRGRMAIQLLKNHPQIAKSKQEANPDIHKFYISQEDEALHEKTRKQDLINDAAYNIVELWKKETVLTRYQIACLLKDSYRTSIIKGDVNDERVKSAINEYIHTNSANQINNIETFNKYVGMLSTEEGRKRLLIEYMIVKAIDVNTMGIQDGYYTWFSKRGIDNVFKLGTDLNKVIKFFGDEYEKYSPDDKSTNWFGELAEELNKKGVRLPA